MERNETEEIIYKIYQLLASPMRTEELLKALPEAGKKEVKKALNALITQGLVMKNKKNRYAQSTHYGCYSGTFIRTGRGYSFVSTGEDEEDILIPFGADGGAWHKDRVMVKADGKRTRSGRREGEVIRVLSRSGDEIPGTLEQKGTRYFLRPSDKKFPVIEIDWRELGGADTGDFVAASIISYGDGITMPQGKVNAVLGQSGTMEASIAAILRANGVKDEFPEDVIRESESIPQEVAEIKNRLDLRDRLIITIDGDDAKDFDDAVSIELLENGHYLLGVHIADVSNYVKPGSYLDMEAYKRGASVYFPGHVVPMLPFALSNGICSLNPGVDRLAFSALMEIDKDGRRHKSEFVKSVIRSKARMTYKKANLILEGDAQLRNEYSFLVETIETMNRLAKTLYQRRVKRGALELDIPEVEINVDEEGYPTGLEYRQRGDSEKLIEEFMLMANESVAEYMCLRGYPTVYRVHERPDPDKLRLFAQFARPFGYRIDPGDTGNTFQLQEVLNGVRSDPRQRILPMLLLRSLARAKYAEDCIGHYGLKAKFYLHFTSPIRRYPDLVAHRMLQKAISGQEFADADRETCADAASQSSARELAADTCERDIDRLFIACYMKQFIGEEFDAEICNVKQFGVFVALGNGCEGLIRIELLDGDFYEYDEQHMALQGRSTGKRFSIGMPVKVRLLSASELTGQVDFALAGTELPQPVSYENEKNYERPRDNREKHRRNNHRRRKYRKP